MEKSNEDRHLIDRFLQGEMSGIEMENFNKRVSEDDKFRSAFEFQKTIYSGIQMADHERLKGIILSSLNYRKPAIPFALKLIVTFLLVTGFGITLWFYVGDEAAHKDQAKSWFAFLNSRRNNDNNKIEIPKQKPESRSKISRRPASFTAKEDTMSWLPDSAQANAIPEVTSADSIRPEAMEEDIIVKQDQLMIVATIAVEDKVDGKVEGTDDQLTSDVRAMLNPAADLPEGEKAPSGYEVEFWISPINYKGYKMSKNKLILFGIDEPESVKLFRVNDALYMTYLRDYYRLNASFDFISYQKLKDSEIPMGIK